MLTSLGVAVIDYDAGNTLSVTRALEKVGARVDLTPDPERAARADAVVLPGVGAFGDCVGLQVLFEGSEESPGIGGLGVLPGGVVRFEAGDLRVPHMGWNQLEVARAHPVLEDLDGEAFYFVHSYYPDPAVQSDVLGTAEYGARFCAAAGRENLVAAQFHPEKSSRAGLKLYEN